MSKRNIEKHILMNKAEAQDLQKKAKRACLSEGGLIRLLLKGYEPREKLKKEAERWHKFQADVERTFLRPDKSDMKWQ